MSGSQVQQVSSGSTLWSELYNLAVRAGVQSCLDGVAKAQVSNLLEMVWYFDADNLVQDLILYMGRQTARRKFSRNAMKFLIEGLLRLQKNNMASRQTIARFIGIYRWVYEICMGVRLRVYRNQVPSLTLEEFINLLKS